ncbi:tRNA lysidine(34) synthetase TilS [Ruminococcus flavefaciens]|uniref:tRNA lysidine(34) synthetase TilS n=1 Tax=Ruminococcus flavefaciens TaxID=1265 RepID=UPI0026EB8E75|nr:tRNA lysidine(34) synthetase TilS [Ruminococcus flavefaciens]MDD7517239.1 tRNA lysidine(34) synthetase TilS [Ruminococcus flavefaciens]MDY5691254.1 tRNA lysidine(34) synthetase TilS [Ruminococcus flavefaciens]
MLAKVYDFIIKNNMLSENDMVVCGLSGGADSVALLLALYELKEKLDITVESVHVNHCLRGAESDRDEMFCRELCKRLGITFQAVSCDVKGLSVSENISTEEAARKLRYKIFEEHSKGKKLATAHNANDNLETVIHNLTRGTGIKGLAGIPVKRGNIIRPLLTVTRQEIEDFLKKRGQEYVTDSTNLTDDYTRNKIRHRVIPILNELNNSVNETSVNTINAIREENDLIESIVSEAEKKCRNGNCLCGLSKFHPVIRKRCIAHLITENSLPYSFSRLEEADNILMNGGKINLSNDIYLVSSNNKLELKVISQDKEKSVFMPLSIGKNQPTENCTVMCELLDCDNLKKIEAVHKNSTFYVADYDKIRGRLIVRTRKFGDKIKLKGRNFTSSIKKLINERIPAEERPDLLFIEDEDGTVLAEKLGIAERIAVDNDTVRFLKISFIRY